MELKYRILELEMRQALENKPKEWLENEIKKLTEQNIKSFVNNYVNDDNFKRLQNISTFLSKR